MSKFHSPGRRLEEPQSSEKEAYSFYTAWLSKTAGTFSNLAPRVGDGSPGAIRSRQSACRGCSLSVIQKFRNPIRHRLPIQKVNLEFEQISYSA